jgi:MFS superfamily sulfate permease-like transporter
MNARTAMTEALASVVVFLVALPLCMGIAIASGVPPAMGIVSGIIGGIIVGTLAGSPLQVSGPAAGLAVIVYEIVHTHGVETLGPILVLAGLIQAVAGRLSLGQWFRAVAPAVIYAMLAGIGVLIFASQFHVMVDDKPVSNGIINVITIPNAIYKGLVPVDDSPHHLAAGIGVLTLCVLIGWNWVRTKVTGPLRSLPAPLLAVSAAVAAASYFQLPIKYVEVPSEIGSFFSLPTLATFGRLSEPAILGSAFAVAIIASAEALLCAVAVDKLHDGDATDLDQELFAQGIGNTVAGFVGGLPITGVIVRSTANVESGAKTRWSAVLHGFWLLGAVALVPFLLAKIPVSSLAAILVYIGYKLVKPEVPKALLARGRGELAIYLITVFAIVATNLLEGLMVGFALSLLKLAWNFSHLEVDVSGDPAVEGKIDLRLRGSGTFVGLPVLARSLNAVPAGREIHVHLEEATYVDHACFELLSDWRKQYESRGGEVIIEWETLEKRGEALRSRTAA